MSSTAVCLSRQQGVLSLRIAREGGKSVLRDLYQSHLLKVMKPFYPDETGQVLLYIMSPSGGMMQGDAYRIEVDVGRGAAATLTTQAAGRVHKTTGLPVEQRQIFRVGEEALLEWLPDEVIPYAASSFHGETQIHLSPSSHLLFAEVLASGRISRGESFAFTQWRNRTSLYVGGRLTFQDHLHLTPSSQPLLTETYFAGHTYYGQMFCYTSLLGNTRAQPGVAASEFVQHLQQQVQSFPGVYAGLSVPQTNLLLLRALSTDVQSLHRLIHWIRSSVRAQLLFLPEQPLRK